MKDEELRDLLERAMIARGVAEKVIALVKQAGYVQLSDDQIPPAIRGEEDSLDIHRDYWNDGWRKIKTDCKEDVK